jgi:N-acetylglucosaminyl-diphospho-decaprenol L-rhamnosyltransferase
MSPDIVIVNFRSADLIGRAVVVAREFAGGEARLIVVDNSPGDGASEVLAAEAPDATVLTNSTNRGFAAAVNQAIAVTDADIVFLLNPDVEHISGSYADVTAAFRDRRVAAVAARLLNSDRTEQPNCFRAPRPFDLLSEDLALAERLPGWRRSDRLRMPEWTGSDPRRVDWAAGACLFLRRAALDDVGPFDERFFVYCEETDWLVRAKERGWHTLFLPTVEATHASAGSSPGVPTRPSLLLLESQHRYARKHYGPLTAALIRAALLGFDTARFVRHGLGRHQRKRADAMDRIRVHLTLRAPRPA